MNNQRSASGFAKNVFSLTTVQIVSYAIPLLTIPYLTRVLGLEAWGMLAFYQAMAAIATMLVNWGFPIYATMHAARRREDAKWLGLFLGNVLLAQGLLLGLVSMAVLVSMILSEALADELTFMIGMWLITLSAIVFPSWIYQALELFRFVAIAKIISRVVPVPLIFIAIKQPEDAPVVLILNAVMAIIVGLVALSWLTIRYGIRLKGSSVAGAARVLADSTLLFISAVATTAYTSLIPVVLGAVSGPNEVAIFSLADRVKTLLSNIFIPVSQSLLPRMSFLISVNAFDSTRFLWIVGIISAATLTAAGGLTFLFAPKVVDLLGGAQFSSAATTLRVLAFVPAVVVISNMIGVQFLIPSGHQRLVNLALVTVAALAVCFMHTVVEQDGALGAAALVLLSELFVSLSMIVIVLKIRKPRPNA